MHCVTVGDTHTIKGVNKVQHRAARLPVTIEPSIDFRIQVNDAETHLEHAPFALDRYLHLADLYLSCRR